MDFLFSKTLKKKTQTLIFFDTDSKITDSQKMGSDLSNQYEAFKKQKSFEPNFKKHLMFTNADQTIYVFGIDKKTPTSLALEKLGGHVFSTLSEADKSAIEVCFNFDASAQNICHFAMGFQSKNYSFTKYKSEQKTKPCTLTLTADHALDAKKEWPNYDAICQGMSLTRDLVNEPPNMLTTTEFTKIIQTLKKLPNISVEILDEKKLEKLGMEALLAVGRGSHMPSYIAVIKYQGDKKQKTFPLALVGKGITFDTGGNSLKPAGSMVRMKGDLGGAATVTGLMKALALRNAKTNVVAVLAIAENMCAGNAQRPDDVVKSYSGQTIEVLNTDAEGRLVLADALWYAQEKFAPNTVINLATLTGAILVSLGHLYAGLFTNSDALAGDLLASSNKTNDLIWRMPLHKEYDKLIDCDIADMKNIGPPMNAGSVVAAQFLQRFIQDGVKWAHLDIAGTSDTKTGNDYTPKAASGWGVRLLNQFITDQFES